MAILFDWYENPKSPEQQGEENTLHPRLRLNGKVSTAQLRARIQKHCTLTETDVVAPCSMRCHVPWARSWRKANRCIWTASVSSVPTW